MNQDRDILTARDVAAELRCSKTHVCKVIIGSRTLGDVTRDDLQDLLDEKASAGRSHSLVGHLRWDLKQIFDLARAEGFISRNPAAVLFTPRNARREPRLVMNLDQVRKVFSLLGLR